MQHDEAGQVPILATEPVAQPRADARSPLQEHAGVHLQHRGRVVVRLRVARVDEGHVIDVLGHVGEDLRDPGTRLAMLLEVERRLQKFAAGGEEAGLGIGALELHAVVLLQFRLEIESVDLRRAPRHEQPDHRLRLGREVRTARVQQVRRAGGTRRRDKTLLFEQASQRQGAAAEPSVSKERSA